MLQPARPEMCFSTKFKMDLESGFSTEKACGCWAKQYLPDQPLYQRCSKTRRDRNIRSRDGTWGLMKTGLQTQVRNRKVF